MPQLRGLQDSKTGLMDLATPLNEDSLIDQLLGKKEAELSEEELKAKGQQKLQQNVGVQ